MNSVKTISVKIKQRLENIRRHGLIKTENMSTKEGASVPRKGEKLTFLGQLLKICRATSPTL